MILESTNRRVILFSRVFIMLCSESPHTLLFNLLRKLGTRIRLTLRPVSNATRATIWHSNQSLWWVLLGDRRIIYTLSLCFFISFFHFLFLLSFREIIQGRRLFSLLIVLFFFFWGTPPVYDKQWTESVWSASNKYVLVFSFRDYIILKGISILSICLLPLETLKWCGGLNNH